MWISREEKCSTKLQCWLHVYIYAIHDAPFTHLCRSLSVLINGVLYQWLALFEGNLINDCLPSLRETIRVSRRPGRENESCMKRKRPRCNCFRLLICARAIRALQCDAFKRTTGTCHVACIDTHAVNCKTARGCTRFDTTQLSVVEWYTSNVCVECESNA